MLLFLTLITTVHARNIGLTFCDTGDDLTKQCYEQETLLAMAHSPNQLAVDKQSNDLYFSFDSGQGENVVAIFKIETKELKVLKGVTDAFAIAIDESTREIYFGGSHGIYKYDLDTKILRRLNIRNLDIWWIHATNSSIYFIQFPSLNTYCYSNGTILDVDELKDKGVHQLAMDTDENIIFNNSTGLFGIIKDADKAVLLKTKPKFLNMALDNRGLVHLCSDDGIYSMNKLIHKVKRIFPLQGVLGLTFDRSNNIIYSTSHELIRIIPIKDTIY